VHGRLASLNRNAFFYQSEWGGGKEGEKGRTAWVTSMLAQRAASESPRWTRAVRRPPRLYALG